MAKLDHIEINGTPYELVPEIAPLFNTSTQYSTGDYVIKDAILYKFITNHAAGAWNASHVTATSVIDEINGVVDNTLTTTGKAADAKATGDALASKINSDIVAPEFSDSTAYSTGQMVLKNGVLYKFTAAHLGAWTGTDAETVTVEGEIERINDDIKLYTGNADIDFTPHKYIDTSKTTITISDGKPAYSGTSGTYSCGISSCASGDVFTVSGHGGIQTRLYAFVDSSGNVLERSPSEYSATDLIVTAPENSAWLIIHTNDSQSSYLGAIIKKRVATLENDVKTISEKVGYSHDITNMIVFTQGLGTRYSDGNTSSDSVLSGSSYFDVSGFDKMQIAMRYAVTSNSYGVAFYDSEKSYIIGYRENYGAEALASEIRTFDIPQGATYARTTWFRNNQAEYNTNVFSCVLVKDSEYAEKEYIDEIIESTYDINSWTKGVVNAINSRITTSDNGATAGPINVSRVVFGTKCRAVIRMWKNGTYLGKCKNDGTIDKNSGNWKYFIGEVDTAALMANFNADAFDFSILPTDSTAITSETVSTYGNSHIDAYAKNFATKSDVDAVGNDVSVLTMAAEKANSATSNVIVINHRGFNTVAPENTLPAFILSAQHGFAYVETDVLFTAPDNNNPLGVPVLLHDASINRTARNADGTQLSSTVYIADITYAEALTYDFGIWKGQEWAGTKIPTLEEFIKLCKKYGLHPYIELKDEKTYTQDEIDLILSIITANGMKKHVSFISYDDDALTLVKNRWDWVELGMHTSDTNVSALQALKSDNNEVFATHGMYASIPNVMAAGFPACPYTVDTIAQLQGLDPYYSYILTNVLTLREIRENMFSTD